jgi:hypothetical protein
MAPSGTSQPLDPDQMQHSNFKTPNIEPTLTWPSRRSKGLWTVFCIFLLVLGAAVGAGLGVGLRRGSKSSSTSGNSPPQVNTTTPHDGNYWQPIAGATWQIVLSSALNNTAPKVTVYDIDLFENPASTVSQLHVLNRSVICYFSAGSFEDFRPDASQFHASDYAKPLDGWPGEFWLNTRSANVRRIMTDRLQLASRKGCDGVDPDNVDGYSFNTGFDLTQADALDYLNFLVMGAHGLNMSIGLKNAAEIVNKTTVDMMQWAVNEQCLQYQECDVFQSFIKAGKPVFHIEYPSSAPTVSASVKRGICDDHSAQGFSTILKDMSLDDWLEAC